MTDPVQTDKTTTPGEPAQAPAAAAQPAQGTAGAGKEAAPQQGSTLEEQLAAAKKEAVENYNRYLRAVADLDNSRKRAIREKEEVRQFGIRSLVEDLLPVLDNLALGMAAAKQAGGDAQKIVGGVEMTINQLKSALANNGLTEVNPLGQPFDPHQHEAISHVPSTEVKAEHVLNVVRTGYLLQGRLLRPASVVVSSGPAKADS